MQISLTVGETGLPARDRETEAGGLVFLSWSGKRSKRIALALNDLLPKCVRGLTTWMSTEIGPGSPWRREITEKLQSAHWGIVCVTAENQGSPWLLFEAGRLSDRLGVEGICPYLVGLSAEDLEEPLNLFQAVEATKEATRELCRHLRRRSPLGEFDEGAFENAWPAFDAIRTEVLASPAAHTAVGVSPEDARAKLTDLFARHEEIWFSAKDHHQLLGAHAKTILEAATRGIRFRFLMPDPEAPSLADVMQRSSAVIEDRRERMRRSVSLLRGLSGKCPGTVDFRLHNVVPVCSVLLAGPRHPELWVELYGYKLSQTDRIWIRSTDPEDPVFRHFHAQLMALWNAPKPLVQTDEKDESPQPVDFETAHSQGIRHRAVHVEIVSPDGKYLVLKRFDERWEILGGHVDWLEPPGEPEAYLDAAIRETVEELDLVRNWGIPPERARERLAARIRQLSVISNELPSSHGENREWIGVFRVEWQPGWRDPASPDWHPSEEVKGARWLPPSAMPAFVKRNRVNSALQLFAGRHKLAVDDA